MGGDAVGLPLDLDLGSMTVWKGDVKLGVMQPEGLTGLGGAGLSGRQGPHRLGAGARAADAGGAGGGEGVAGRWRILTERERARNQKSGVETKSK